MRRESLSCRFQEWSRGTVQGCLRRHRTPLSGDLALEDLLSKRVQGDIKLFSASDQFDGVIGYLDGSTHVPGDVERSTQRQCSANQYEALCKSLRKADNQEVRKIALRFLEGALVEGAICPIAELTSLTTDLLTHPKALNVLL